MTGANKGIGFEIVRQLCRQFDGKVLLAGNHAYSCLLVQTSDSDPTIAMSACCLHNFVVHVYTLTSCQWRYYRGVERVYAPQTAQGKGGASALARGRVPCYAYVVYMAMCHVAS